jgi:hypothetical protein
MDLATLELIPWLLTLSLLLAPCVRCGVAEGFGHDGQQKTVPRPVDCAGVLQILHRR